MKTIITAKDIVSGDAKPEDVEFGWKMFYIGNMLQVMFWTTNVDLSISSENEASEWLKDDVKLKRAKDFGTKMHEIGQKALKARHYDQFVIYGHADNVISLDGAKKYFKDHHVNDVDVDMLFNEMSRDNN